MKTRIYSYRQTRSLAECLALAGLSMAAMSQSALAANITFTLTPTTNVWSTDTWSSAIAGVGAGDIAQFNTAGTATTSVDTLGITLGQLQTGTTGGSIWNLTAGGGSFVLDGSGITSGNQAFGNAGVAAIASRNALGNLSVAPNISFGTTALDIGTTSTGTVTIGGNITATAAQTLNFRGSGTGGVIVNGTIGNSGNAGINVFISRSGNSATTGTAPSPSAVTFNGANGYTGTTTIDRGYLVLGSSTATIANSAVTIGTQGNGTAIIPFSDNLKPGGALSVVNNAGGTVARTASLTINGANLGANSAQSLVIYGNSSATTAVTNDTFGALTLNTGAAFYVAVEGIASTTANATATFSSLTRSAGSVIVAGIGTAASTGIGTVAAGSTTSANTGNIIFTSAPTLTGSGGAAGTTSMSILPYAFVNNTIATYDATNGLRALNTSTEMATLSSGMTAGQNAKITTGTITISADTSINSLYGTGGTISFNADTTKLNVTSGAVVANVGYTIGSGTAGGNGILNFGSSEGTIYVANSRGLTVNSAIAGSNGLTVNLASVNGTAANLVLSNANTITGTARFVGNNSGSTVRLTNSLALQNLTLDYNNYGASFIFGNGGTTGQTAYTFGGLKGVQNINLSNNNTSAGAVALTVGGNNDSTTYSGVLSNSVAGGSLIKVGTGTLTLSGTNTYTGGTTISAGTLSFANGSLGTTGNITVNGGALQWNGSNTQDISARLVMQNSGSAILDTNGNNVTLASAVGGSTSSSLTKSGLGTLALNAANTFSGGLTVKNGTVSTTNAAGFGTGTLTIGDTTGSNNATASTNTGNNTIANNVVIAAGSSGTATIADTAGGNTTTTYSGTVTANKNFTINNAGAAGSGNTLAFNGKITASGDITVDSSSSPFTNLTWFKNSGNAISGNITLQNAATLGTVTGALGSSNVVTIDSTSQLNTEGQSLTIGGLNGSGTVVVSNSPSQSLTVAGSGTYSYGGVISNSGGLIKSGTGTQALSGTNTYTGATSVTAGTLKVSGSIGSSAVSVSNANSVLASGTTGTIGSSVAVNNLAILAPGDINSVGTATVNGATTFNNGSIFSWDISATGTSYDKLVTTGVVDGDTAGSTVFRIVAADSSFSDAFWTSTQNWSDIFTTDGTSAVANWANLFTTVQVFNSSGSQFTPLNGSFSVSGSTLTWSAVPEPSSALAGLLVAAGLLRRRRL